MTLAAYLEEAREQRWLERYYQACEHFTYPKCPQLQTSQGMVNNAKRKRVLNADSEDAAETEKAANKKRPKRRTPHKEVSQKSGGQLEPEEKSSESNPLESQRLENLWVQAESFAIFDEEDEEGSGSESSEGSVAEVENGEITFNEWI
jgi:hypothetical protein